MHPYIGLHLSLVLFSSLFMHLQQILFLSILQSINHDIISTPAVSVPADQKAAQTLFTSTLPTPISIPIVPRPTTNIQVIYVQFFSLSTTTTAIIIGLEVW